MAKGKNSGVTIVLKRIEEGGHAHHGGAWKVAYADFVTAMMAFFLLMWLLNATTEEQRRGIADYFAPSNIMGRSESGTGLPFGGRTPHESTPLSQDAGAIQMQRGPMPVLADVEIEDDSDTLARPVPRRDSPEGEDEEAEARRLQRARADAPPGDADPRRLADGTEAAPRHDGEPRQASDPAARRDGEADPRRPGDTDPRRPGEPDPRRAGDTDPRRLSDAALRAEHARRERAAFEQAAAELRAAVAEDPQLAEFGRQLLVEQVPEGLRIQIVDAERQPMFALGGSAPNERARLLLARVTQVVQRLPNAIAIAGHTDATPFRGGTDRSNWDLSAERANVTRRLLTESGLPEARIRSVTGNAERDLLLPDQPNAAANRRVSITLLRQQPPAGATP